MRLPKSVHPVRRRDEAVRCIVMNMPSSARALALSCALTSAAIAQSSTVLEGTPTGEVRIVTIDPWAAPGSESTVVLDQVLLRAIDMTTRTEGEKGDLHRTRHATLRGTQRIERVDAARLFVFERTTHTGHGILFVPADGRARIAYEGTAQLDIPLAVGTDGAHLAFARGQSLTIVRLDGTLFPGTAASVRTVTTTSPILDTSLVAGPTHAFFVTDDDRVHRIGLAAGAPEDLTPAGSGSPRQSERLAISGDGNVVAYLRGDTTDMYAAWVAGTSGPSRKMPLPEREYREPEYLPYGNGQPHLLLDHTGSRLMVTEIATEDELHFVDTAPGNAPVHMTADESFADYIGMHILPSFRGSRLMFASGHLGWMDWYALQPDGSIRNLTQTGSPEPQYLLGAIDVRQRFALGDGRALATEGFGNLERLRRLDPAGSSTILFSDLVTAPIPGAAIGGTPDLRVVGLGGERILSGTSGQPILSAPAGILLTDPVRGPHGIVATWAHLDVGIGFPVLLWGDNAILLGNVAVGVPQLGWTAAGELTMLWPDRLEVVGFQGSRVVPLAPTPRSVISGAGG